MPSKRSRRPKGAGSKPTKREDGRWSAYVTIGYRDGKPQRQYVYGSSERECVQAQNKLLGKSSSMVLPTRESLTVIQWLRRFADERGKNRASGTRKQYGAYVVLVEKHLGDLPLTKFAGVQARALMSRLADAKLSGSYRRHAFTFFSSAFKSAMRLELIERNPMDFVDDLPKSMAVRERGAWSLEEEQKVKAVLKGHNLEFLLRLCLRWGLRIGEALALRWDDLHGDVLEIEHTLDHTRAKGGALFNSAKSGSDGALQMDFESLSWFESQRAKQLVFKTRALEAQVWQENNLIFSSEVGTPLQYRNVTRAFAVIVKKAGVRNFSTHVMRRTFITGGIQSGFSVATIQKIVRHKSSRMTTEIYNATSSIQASSQMQNYERVSTPYDTLKGSDS
jgi:integrase